MQILTKVKVTLFEPNTFFKRNKEKGISGAVSYIAIFSLFLTLMNMLVYYTVGLSSMALMESITNTNQSIIPPFSFFLYYVFLIIATFFIVAIFFILIRVLGSKKPYADMYQVFAYSSTPYFIFGWIPFFKIIAIIWSVVLLVKFGSQKMQVSITRAILAFVIIPACIIFFMLFFIGLLIFILGMAAISLFSFA